MLQLTLELSGSIEISCRRDFKNNIRKQRQTRTLKLQVSFRQISERCTFETVSKLEKGKGSCRAFLALNDKIE